MAESNQNEELTKAANRLLHYFEGVWEETGASLDQKDIERILREELGKEAPMPHTDYHLEETGDEQLARELAERLQILYGYQVGLNDLVPALMDVLEGWNTRALPIAAASSPSVTSVEAEAEKSANAGTPTPQGQISVEDRLRAERNNRQQRLETLQTEHVNLRALTLRLVNEAQTVIDNSHWEVRYGSGDLLKTIKEVRAIYVQPVSR